MASGVHLCASREKSAATLQPDVMSQIGWIVDVRNFAKSWAPRRALAFVMTS